MTTALDFCIALQRVHASLQLTLDDTLGTYYGIDFNDFVLLDLLAQTAEGKVRIDALVRPLGRRLPMVMTQLIALEKIGFVSREGASGARYASLRPPGRTVLNLARETATDVCATTLEASKLATLAATSKALALRQQSAQPGTEKVGSPTNI